MKPDDIAVLCCPCNSATTKEANRLASRFYGRESIDFHLYEQWRQKNPRILVCLINDVGDVQGYFDVLPLRKKFIDLFVAGKVTEGDITHEDILSSGRARRCKHLYFSGIAVRNPEIYVGRRNASILAWGVIKYLEHFYPLDRSRQVFALASTREGEALLRKFNFQLVTPASARVDKHNLYMLPLSSDSLKKASLTVPDWGTVCRVGW